VVFDDHVYWCWGASLLVSPPKFDGPRARRRAMEDENED
jgi:hypothetical protein